MSGKILISRSAGTWSLNVYNALIRQIANWNTDGAYASYGNVPLAGVGPWSFVEQWGICTTFSTLIEDLPTALSMIYDQLFSLTFQYVYLRHEVI